MKSMNNNNWLGFSLSPQINMEVSSESEHQTHHQSNQNTSSLFYEGDNTELYSQLSLMPIKSDGSLCIMEALNRSQNQGMVPSPSPKLEDFLGGPNIGAHDQYVNNDKEATTMYYYQQLPFRNQPYFHPLQDEMYNNFYNEIEGTSIGGMGYGDLHSLSLSMSPGTQSSTVTAQSNIPSVGVNDCMALDATKKRGSGKLGQKQPVHRKSIDTFGQRTSQYRGVTRHRWTGRYEAHLWDNSCKKEGQTRKGRQVYLGGYDLEDKAARAYDLAALKYWGPSTHINFPLENYLLELEEMKNMSRQEYVAHLRRKSSGFSRGASIYRGVTRHHQHGRWQARIGRVAGNKDLYLGTFSTQEDAAEAYDIAAIKFRGASAVTNFDITRYDVERIMSSTTLLSGENARRTKAISAQDANREINLTEENYNIVDYEPPNQILDQNQRVSVAFNGLLGVEEPRKMASTHFSNPSSLVTSLNSSREDSPEPKFSICTNPTGSWMPTTQIRPAFSLTHMPVFAAWSDI